MRTRGRALLLGVVLLALVAAGLWWERSQFAGRTAQSGRTNSPGPSPRVTTAQVERAPVETVAGAPHLGRPTDGFVGSAACLTCHVDEYGSWHRSYHRTMTQVATPESVRAPFDGRVLENRGRTFRVRRDGDAFFVRMLDPAADHGPAASRRIAPLVERRVVMVTGSHHMQVYWVESEGPEREQFILPFVFLLGEEQRWVPREDAFVVPPDAGFMHAMWNDNCIRCHATGAQPALDPATGRYDTRVAELGIACEACHGPAGEHVRFHSDPANEDAPAHAITHPLQLPVVAQAQVCGQCHAITGPPDKAADESWFVQGYTYRAGGDLWATRGISRHPAKAAQAAPRTPAKNFDMPTEQLDIFFWPDGMMRVSGREYNGLLESACYQRGDMTCLSCHSLHDSDPNDQLAENRRGDGACVDCHEEIASALTAHTHHAPSSTGSRCMNCHMPHTSYGLYSAIRSHQISSPSATESLAAIGRPNACNLCHLDQTMAWTAEHLTRWYDQAPVDVAAPYDRLSAGLLWLLRGDAGQRALAAWHFGWSEAGAASGRAWLAPPLSIAAASDPYGAVRYIAARSLRRLPGFETWSFDFLAPQAERTASGKAAYDLWQALPRPPAEVRRRVGYRADGSLSLELMMQLQKERDNKPVFLGE